MFSVEPNQCNEYLFHLLLLFRNESGAPELLQHNLSNLRALFITGPDPRNKNKIVTL